MAKTKFYTIKIYEPDGSTFIANVNPEEIKSKPNFTSRINGGYGECVLDLNRSFDDFDEGNSIDFMNVVEIYAIVVKDRVQTSYLIYTGFISRYTPYIKSNGEEGVEVNCLGLVSILPFAYYTDSGYTVIHSTQDPETIGRAIIDNVNSDYNLFSYSNDTTDSVGTNVSVTFSEKKWFDCLKTVRELSAGGWWWKIDEAGQYWLKNKPTTADHTFTLGVDVESITAPKSAEQIVNDVVVQYDGGIAVNADSTSITNYGRRATIISDSSLTDLNAGQQRANKEKDDGKDPVIMATLIINDEYDIETVKVGQGISLANYDKDNTFFESVMQAVSVQYMGDKIKVELGEEPADFGSELQRFVS